MSINTPITAAGSSADYTSAFKKHFGDRPVAFALSESRPSTSSSSHPSHGGPTDPFAASSSTSFASRSVTREEGVDETTRTQLANLGWRIRATVNQGYSRTATTSPGSGSGSGLGFVSERDVLRNVSNSRRGWSRVSTAPSAATFDGMRCIHGPDNDMSTPPAPAAALQKRARRLSDSDHEEHPMQDAEEEEEAAERCIKGLPKLSFSSSTSSASSMLSTSPYTAEPAIPGLLPAGRSKSFVRTHSTHIPPSGIDVDMHEEAYDFSTHFGRTDF